MFTGAVGALFAVVLAACSESSLVAPARSPLANQPLPAAERYLVELVSAGAPPARFVSAVQAAGGVILRAHQGTGIVLVARLSANAANALRSQPDVALIVPDLRMRFITDPPLVRRVSSGVRPKSGSRLGAGRPQPKLTPLGMNNPRNAQLYGDQWDMTNISADTAWQITSQGLGQHVFILDSGIDTLQQDLRGNVDLVASTTFAFAPTDTFELNPLPWGHDVVGHGTFVSSLIAGNSLGMAAVAPQATLTMVRVLDDDGFGSWSALIEGILYAADSGADVINMSIGGYFPRDQSYYLAFADYFQRAVDYAFQRGVLLVAAAGNDAVNTNTAGAPSGSYADSLEMPAGLHHILSIGATGPILSQYPDTIAIYSNYGDAGVGVFAPGGNVVDYPYLGDLVVGACSADIPKNVSPCPMSAEAVGADTGYAAGAGTSFAAPHVVGEAAVVKARASGFIFGQALETCILNTATEINPGVRPDPLYNYGRIDVLKAITSTGCE